MYIEVQVVQNGILVGGRSYVDIRESMDAVRKALIEASPDWERAGFRTWQRVHGNDQRMHIACWPR